MLTVLFNILILVADTEHHFNASESDWGFTSFIPFTELHDPGRGYLVDDKIILEVDVSLPKSQ